MKLFIKYLIEKRRLMLCGALFFSVFAICFLLYGLPLDAVLYPSIVCVFFLLLFTALDFLKVGREHIMLKNITTFVDAEQIPRFDGIINEDLREIIELLQKEHTILCAEKEESYADMVNYYTVWVHQIKTPITSMRLLLESEDSRLGRELISELRRIEGYVDMVLTFLRLNSDSTDYLIKEYELDDIVGAAVRSFSSEFIGRGIALNYRPLEKKVLTDKKWLLFVIEQVISNALKYTPSGSITITLEPLSGGQSLIIRDTGIGISQADIPRVFENGYTGLNGRTDKKSSGIGLCLCRRICLALGHSIDIDSESGHGTSVRIGLERKKLEIE